MKLVFLDVKTIGDDLDLSPFDQFGEVVKYSFSAPSEVPGRIQDADVIIVNKIQINETTIGSAKNLKLVCVTATGTNNLDKAYLDAHGIAWRNVAGYSTETVAQHTFAMLLFLLEKLRYYDDYVKEERYVNDVSFTHFAEHFTEIHGKTWGIIGLGAIGRRVAEIARAFGAKVIYYSASGAPAQEGYEQVDFETLLTQSDIISVHAPLNEHTEGLINSAASFGQKLGNGLSTVLLGVILNIGGYVGSAKVQTSGALTSIKAGYIYVPIILTVIQIVVLYFYHLDKEYEGILADLNGRKAAK